MNNILIKNEVIKKNKKEMIHIIDKKTVESLISCKECYAVDNLYFRKFFYNRLGEKNGFL